MAFHNLSWTPFEPKMKNRFLFFLDPAGPPSYIVNTAQRPTFNMDPIAVDYINIQRKFKGKATWSNITITLYDPITPVGAAAVETWIRNHHHNSQTGKEGYAADYKRDLRFDSVGADGEVIETWKLAGAFIANVNYGDFDWSTSDPVDIQLELAYDYAVLEYAGVVNPSGQGQYGTYTNLGGDEAAAVNDPKVGG